MHWRAVFRLFGVLFLFYSLSFLPSLGIAWWTRDGQMQVFATSWLLSATLGLLLWLPNRRYLRAISVREAFFVVTLFWALLGAIGGLPFVLGVHLSFTDAVFESISGDRACALGAVCRPNPGLRAGLLGRGHDALRCHRPRLYRRGHRRVFHP
jgi:Trk-type K+ transport system membrane component